VSASRQLFAGKNEPRCFILIDQAGNFDEVVHMTDIVFTAVASAIKDLRTSLHERSLTQLQIEGIAMQGDFAADRNAGEIRTQIVLLLVETERLGNTP